MKMGLFGVVFRMIKDIYIIVCLKLPVAKFRLTEIFTLP